MPFYFLFPSLIRTFDLPSKVQSFGNKEYFSVKHFVFPSLIRTFAAAFEPCDGELSIEKLNL